MNLRTHQNLLIATLSLVTLALPACQKKQAGEVGQSVSNGAAQTQGQAQGQAMNQGTQKAVAPSAEAEAPRCQTLTFQRKAGQDPTEKNLISVPNSHSLCIRVDGTPVKYRPVKGKKNQFMIESVPNPTSKITARYCTAKVNCSDDCSVPKDEFLDAIGGEEKVSEKLPAKLAQWDPNDPDDENVDLQAEIEKMMPEAAGVRKPAGNKTAEWVIEKESPACESALTQLAGK